MTQINETKSTYKGREVYAQTAKAEWSCTGCALDPEPAPRECKKTGPCTPEWAGRPVTHHLGVRR